ncbi:MAG: KAP family NTPase [Lachnospiraceae bacterium]|nr:KAP family NTPase [Lachnospiraceae bacterium]
MDKIKKYINELNKVTSIIKIIRYSIYVTGIILFLENSELITKCIEYIPDNCLLCLKVGIIILTILWIIQSHYYELFKIKNPTLLDAILVMTLFVGVEYIFYGISLHLYRDIHYIVITSEIFLVMLLLMRISYCSTGFISYKTESNHLYDLKDLYDNNVSVKTGEPILIDESDVEYDLLNRSLLIQHIVQSVVNCRSKKAYVIGLKGEWGSGKTTILNNVKRILAHVYKDNIAIIDFDPQIYGTQESLVFALYDSLLKCMGIKYSLRSNRKQISNISSIISSAPYVGGVIKEWIMLKEDVNDEIQRTKDNVSSLIKQSGKTVVYIIDNLDRLDGDNILLIFRIISSLFDVSGMVFILAYDSKRISKILGNTKKINPKYIEKIVQQEICIPGISDKELKEVYGTCFSNMLRIYGVDEEKLINYENLYKLICSEIVDVRKFKRLINSAFSIAFTSNSVLNRRDLAIIEFIRFTVPELYKSIINNKKYYVSSDTIIDEELYKSRILKESVNKGGKEYFDRLFTSYPIYSDVLGEMFPNVQRYTMKQNILPDYIMKAGDSNKPAPIYSAKFFELYFLYGSNDYLSTLSSVKSTILLINEAENDKKSTEILKNTLCVQSQYMQYEWLLQLQTCLDELNNNKLADFIIGFINCINELDTSTSFLFLSSARKKATYLVGILIEVARLDQLEEVLRNLESRYDLILIFNRISESIRNNRELYYDGVDIEKKIELLNNYYEKLCEEVISNRINIYEDPNYSFQNMWGLLRYTDKIKKPDSWIKEYMQFVISTGSVYRILGDTLTTSVSDKYGYGINDSVLDTMHLEPDVIDRIIDQRKPITDSEKFIDKVYSKYRSGEKDEEGRCMIYTSQPVKLIL